MASRSSVTTYSSRKFNQDTARAKKAAAKGPVVITDRGRPAHVLLTYERYLKLTTKQPDIASLLSMPEAAHIEFEPVRADGLYRTADFT